jgi:iron complex outermembrane receptor protein
MIRGASRLLLCSTVSLSALLAIAPAKAQDGSTALEEIDVIGTTPLGGDGLDRDKYPANVVSVKSEDLRGANSPTVQNQLSRVSPSINLTDVTGNPFNQELFFRGFQASQQNGAPQGLAVYQNGVRINEAFGDTVNFELVPSVAIDQVDIWTNNPVFGLNALGGALSFQTKSGFTYQGLETEFQAGSFGRFEGNAQWGKQVGNWAGYLALEGARDGGWRDFSDSNFKRVFGDVGYKTDTSEIHLNFTYADSKLGVVGPTPFELLEDRRRNVYTGEQLNENKTALINLQGKFELTDAWSLQANAYYRRYESDRVDGNDTDIRPCAADPTLLCLDADDFSDPNPVPGGPRIPVAPGDPRLIVRDVNTGLPLANNNGQGGAFPADEDDFVAGNTPGSIERTRTRTNGAGGTLQASNESELFGHKNHFVIGASYDFGKTDFRGWSELCNIPSNLQCIGTGAEYYTQIPGGILPVELTAKNHYVGLYASNTFDVTDQLSATVGGRWNYAKIITKDKSQYGPLDALGNPAGPNLDGNHSFDRFNPMAGLTYKFTPAITGYASYSESNRAPTPLELGCSNPNIPCPLESTLVSDPPLKQVVTRTGEAGLRGQQLFDSGMLRWTASIYQANNKDDILNVPSVITGRGYFLNAGKTRRQGVELSTQYATSDWTVFANYAYVDATFRKGITLASPNNPNANNGEIDVRKGDHLPGIPAHQLKFGGSYRLTSQWTLGGDAQYFSGQYYVGDEANLGNKLPGYIVFNANTSYQVTEQIRVFGGVKNLFNNKYATYGTFFDNDDIGFLDLNGSKTITPARPISVYAGVNYKFTTDATPVLARKD